jgi:hypothetical protein
MYGDLKSALVQAVNDLAHHYDCGILSLPQVNQYRTRKPEARSLEEDTTVGRLCDEIRELGEKIFVLGDGGIDLMQNALSEFDLRKTAIVNHLWFGIGGRWA